MKNIFILLLFVFPIFAFSQSEIDQKRAKRFGSNNTQITNTESNQKKQEKDNTIYRNNRVNQIYHPSPYFYHDNWLRWGAPAYGFSNFYPIYYYDRFGLRQPGRIYEYNTGKKDTIKGEKLHWRFGLSYNTKNQMGGWLSVGNNKLFMMEYCNYISNDESYFYSDITMSEVKSWDDEQLKDIQLGGVIYLGGGIKFNNLGIYLMPGYGWDKRNYQFFDELYILSNNGKYSFTNYDKKYLTGKFGLLFDYKYVSSKLDYDPFRNTLNFGFGVVL